MVLVYRTRNRHHVTISKVKKTECGRHLSDMDMVQIFSFGISETQFKRLHHLRPFCKVCLRSHGWYETDWRSEDES